jgi:hypothetical protein
MGQDKDGEGVGEQGGVMNSQFFGWGAPTRGGLGLHFDLFLTCFALAHSNTNYIFAEISKNGLGSIPLKVPQVGRRFDNCNGYFLSFCHFIFFRFPFPSCPVNPHVFCMGVYGSIHFA